MHDQTIDLDNHRTKANLALTKKRRQKLQALQLPSAPACAKNVSAALLTQKRMHELIDSRRPDWPELCGRAEIFLVELSRVIGEEDAYTQLLIQRLLKDLKQKLQREWDKD